MRLKLHWLERTLWIAGISLLGWVGFVWADGQIYQSRAEAELEQVLSRPATAAADATPEVSYRELPGEALRAEEEAAPVSVPEATGDLVGRLEIPRLDLSVMVAEGTAARVLRRGAGHLRGTALPGAPGNVAVAGHRDRHFRPLKDVAPGDEILFTTPDGTFRYRIEWTRVVEPRDTHVLASNGEPALTLVTCYPFYFVGNAPQRFIVRAREIGWQPPDEAVPAP